MQGGTEYLETGNDGQWALPLGALVICLRHIGLSGYEQSECMAIENELMMWQQMGGFSHQEEARRLRATLHRFLRLSENFCSIVLDNAFEPAVTLGTALGLSSEKTTGM